MVPRIQTPSHPLALGLILSLVACTPPAASPPASRPAGVAVSSGVETPHETFSVLSGALGELRAVNVWTPPGYGEAPASRWPVLYMPDGGMDEDFPHVVRTVDSLLARRSIRPVIVVGIPNTQRRRDLTGPTRVKADSAIAPRVGGSASFRRFIEAELIPAIDSRYRTTGERAIIGESLAGLFVLETFFTQPALFTHYVSLDPGLWWNEGALVDSAAIGVSRMDSGSRSLYLATADYAETATAAARIAATLRATAPPRLRWRYVARPDLTHATIFRGVEADALAEALR